jgi:hypothetical protein
MHNQLSIKRKRIITIKSLFVALGISISGLSAAEPAQADLLKDLVTGFAEGTKTVGEVRQYLRDFQARIYDWVDSGDLATAKECFETEEELLLPMFAAMSDKDRISSGAETLCLIADYIRIHKN